MGANYPSLPPLGGTPRQVSQAINYLLSQLQTAQNREAISTSWTAPTLVATASDAGSSATITIADHTRYYGDVTSVSITHTTTTSTAPVAIAARTNTSSTAQGGGVYRIVKTAGGAPAFDADAISTLQSGDFTLKITLVSNAGDSMFAVNGDPSTDASYTSLDYAIEAGNGGTTIDIWESGSHVGSFGTYSGQILWIKRSGSTLTYETGPAGSTTVLRTVTTSASLGFDCSLYNLSATADIELTAPQTLGSNVFTGQPYSTTIAVYYDDPERAGGNVTYAVTTDLKTAQDNYVEGRHHVATVITPASGGASTYGGSPPPGTGYSGGSGAVIT